MTTAEAIKMLRTIKRTVSLGNKKFDDALDVAISALESQPEHLVNESGDLVKDLVEDTISRQAAIDAVSRGCKEFRGIFAECEKNLNELQSAQPEQPEIVRCKDCKYLLPKGSFCSKDMCCLRGMAHYHNVDIHNDFCSRAERREE